MYLAGSGSGEGYTLTRDERRRVLEIGAEELGGRVPVRAMGVEPRTAAEVIELAEDAVAAGLDATQVYSLDLGHGYVPTADEQRTYLAHRARRTRPATSCSRPTSRWATTTSRRCSASCSPSTRASSA